jgi:hypothetical protein
LIVLGAAFQAEKALTRRSRGLTAKRGVRVNLSPQDLNVYRRAMQRYVSVPEKTLEHWTSQYITSRFSTHAALWWPVDGQDIDIRNFPAAAGKAVQLELKTTTVTGPRRHEVLVDLVQLAEYGRRPLGRQPFYVFPWPDWCGRLEDEASASGYPVADLAFSRSGRGFWFADWMVAMTTRQVSGLLDLELKKHGSSTRRKKSSLVQFEITIPEPGRELRTKATWGPGKAVIDPSPVIFWTDLWAELIRCGRADWPQLIYLPTWMLGSGGPYSRNELLGLLANIPEELSAGKRPVRDIPIVTLEPDGEGSYFAVRPDNEASRRAGSAIGGPGVDNRTVVFLDAGALRIR